jgi:hypothetical protein
LTRLAPGLTGAAYTNNDAAPNGGATATTLFDVDTSLDQVVIQSPPGNGILVATGKLGFGYGELGLPIPIEQPARVSENPPTADSGSQRVRRA